MTDEAWERIKVLTGQLHEVNRENSALRTRLDDANRELAQLRTGEVGNLQARFGWEKRAKDAEQENASLKAQLKEAHITAKDYVMRSKKFADQADKLEQERDSALARIKEALSWLDTSKDKPYWENYTRKQLIELIEGAREALNGPGI